MSTKIFLTSSEIAEILGISRPSLMEMEDSRSIKIQYSKGGHRRYHKDEVTRIIRKIALNGNYSKEEIDFRWFVKPKKGKIWLTVKEVMKELNISYSKLYRLIASDYVKFGRLETNKIRIHISEIERLKAHFTTSVTVNEACNLLGINKTILSKMEKNGEIIIDRSFSIKPCVTIAEIERIKTINAKYKTISEVAFELGITTQTVNNWKKEGKITIQRIGGRKRIPITEIDRIKAKTNDREVVYEDVKELPEKEINVVENPTRSKSPKRDIKAVKAQFKVIGAICNAIRIEAIALIVIGFLIDCLSSLVNRFEKTKELGIICTDLRNSYNQIDIEDIECEDANESLPSPTQENTNPTVWQKCEERGTEVFQKIVLAKHNHQLHPEEQQRARKLYNDIILPFEKLTNNLTCDPGSLTYDATQVFLYEHPQDYDINRPNWTVRTIADCLTEKGTKSASKSQVGRFFKEYQLSRPIRPKLLSPDENYGSKMKRLGKAFALRKETDTILNTDEFKYTSSKVEMHIQELTTIKGLEERSTVQRYSQKCHIEVTGVFDPCTRQLELAELPQVNYEGYLPTLKKLLRKFVDTTKGMIYLVIDNGPIHRITRLQNDLTKEFGDKVIIQPLPTHNPVNLPLEGVWQHLLTNTSRKCNTKEELFEALRYAKAEYDRMSLDKEKGNPYLKCQVCNHTFRFSDFEDQELVKAIERHLCFNIPYLNPYTMFVMRNSMEGLQITDPEISEKIKRIEQAITV